MHSQITFYLKVISAKCTVIVGQSAITRDKKLT